ncbi:hypothetical protein [Mycetocola zhujimingii]|uniref:hypothetical protein n=1 Tax=Mycetocola zhujimingii TaxID=2079792 RepID=UPI000D3891E2|nr:hypothetical protein [Mycetocola zhujimingii]AWB86158.1 hypothetical protein C3E77_05715 [Mycetocola zhujimingii]
MKLRDKVVELLRTGGYNEMDDVLNIGSATFQFDFVFWTSDAGFNLVLGAVPGENLTRKVAALARALDYVESKASITVVVDADAMNATTRSEVSRYARVLLVRTDSAEDDLRVLLPLHLERRVVKSVDPISVMRRSSGDPLIAGSRLLGGSTSEERVRDALRTFVLEPMVKK